MKEIFVIPTTHHQNANYNSNDIAKLLIAINPDVMFSELPKNWDEIKTNNLSQDNQEDCAIKIFQEHKNVKIFNVDLPYRNEIAKSLNLYSYESKIQSILFPVNTNSLTKLQEKLIEINNAILFPEEKINYKYLKSSRFKKMVRCKNRIMEKILKKYHNRNNIFLDYKLSSYFHNNLREEIIVHNCLQVMRNYDRGVLLIGAEHINIINKINKIGKGFVNGRSF
jgi:hypothetical protein